MHARPLRLCAMAITTAACGTADAADGGRVAKDDRPAESAVAWGAPAVIPSLFGALRGPDHRITALEMDGSGRLHALFADDADGDGLSDALLYARMEGGRWTAPERLDPAPGRSESARLVADGAGRVHALWYERTRPATHAREVDALLHRVWMDGRWSPPETVHARRDSADIPTPHLDARVDAAGRIHLVHTVAAGLAESVWAQGRWGAEMATGRDGASPELAPGAGVLAYVAGWATRTGAAGRSDVVVRARLPGGGWGEPVPVHVDPREYSHTPQLAVDGAGAYHLVWLESRGGQLTPRRMLYATSADGKTWSRAAEITPTATDGQILYSPRLAVDGRGAMMLAFTRFGDGGVGRPTHWQMRLAGGRWSPAEQLFAERGESDSEIETADGPGGAVWAVWKSGDGAYYAASARP